MASALFTRRMLICVFTGFSSGLPLYLLLNLLPAWLRTEGINLKVIGAFALIQFPYTWKFLWAPFLDRYVIPALGRRRGWMLLTQLALMATIAWMGTLSPHDELSWVIYAATAVAFLSATQDIAIDAYRRELLSNAELGLGNAVHVNAYRIAGLIPGSLSLILADHLPWEMVFAVTALFMLPGMAMALMVAEPAVAGALPKTLREAVVEPFREFIGRAGVRSALLVLGFIFLYKLGDSMCTALATPFYLDMGFSKSDIGLIAKNAGPVAERYRRTARWAVDAQAGYQPWTMVVRRGPGRVDTRIRLVVAHRSVSGNRRFRASCARDRDRVRSPRRRIGGRGVRSLHSARDPSRLYRHPVRVIHEPRRRAAHFPERDDRMAGRAGWLVRFFHVMRTPGAAGDVAAVQSRAVE